MRFKTGTTLVEFLRDAASDASSILAASTSRPEPGADLSARFEFWRPSHRLQAGPRLAGFRPTIPDQDGSSGSGHPCTHCTRGAIVPDMEIGTTRPLALTDPTIVYVPPHGSLI